MKASKIRRASLLLLLVIFINSMLSATVLAPYQYTFFGLYSEDGSYSGTTDVTVYFDNDTSTSFTVTFTNGYSVYVNDTPRYIDCGNVTIPTGDFSLSGWFYFPAGLASHGGIGRWWTTFGGFNAANASYQLFARDVLGFRGQVSNGSDTQNTAYTGQVTYNRWYFSAMTFDSATGNLRHYLDGVLQDTVSTGWSQVNQNYGDVYDFYMGLGDFNGKMNCYIDEVVLHTSVLTQTEITQDYNVGHGRYTPSNTANIEAWWHLDEGVGNTTADSSGNGFTGGIVNNGTSTWQEGRVADANYYVFDSVPVGFEWNVSYVNVSRYFIPTGDAVEVFWLFDLDAIGEDYLFTVYAYQALLPAWLETARHVNDTERLIERRTINATQNQVPMVMVTGATYFMQIRGSDGTTYDFGIFVPGSNDPTLRLNPITFSSRIQMAYRYLQVEGERNSTNERITVNFNDELNQTTWLDLEIQYKNGTTAWESNTTNPGPTYQFQWTNADNSTNYIGVMEVAHETFGNMTHNMNYPLNPSYAQPFNLTFLGTTPDGFPQSDLISFGIVFSTAAVFSTVTAPVGGFMAIITALALYQLGWVDWNTDLMIMALTLVVILAIHRARRGA